MLKASEEAFLLNEEAFETNNELEEVEKKPNLRGVELGICERLHAAHPNSKWRWVCRPTDFATKGGIARIEVSSSSGEEFLVDVCLDLYSSENGFLVLHRSGSAGLMDIGVPTYVASPSETNLSASLNSSGLLGLPRISGLPKLSRIPELTELSSSLGLLGIAYPRLSPSDQNLIDKSNIDKWFNIVFIGTLNNLISDLNVQGEVGLHIDRDGMVYVGDYEGIGEYEDDEETDDGVSYGCGYGGYDDNINNDTYISRNNACSDFAIVHNFGEMPDTSLWGHIIDRLGEEGLFAEVRSGGHLFVSWV